MKHSEYIKLIEKWKLIDLEYLQERTNEGAKLKDNEIFTFNNDKHWTCKKCNGEILGFRIAFSIHDGPFPHSGSGRCHYQYRPYCKNCDLIKGKPGYPEIPSLGYKFQGGCID